MHGLGRFLTDDGEPNGEIIRKLFTAIDKNNDGQLSASEIKALTVGILFEEKDLDKDDAVQKVMQDFDTSNNNYIDKEEFVNGIKKWLNEAKRYVSVSADDTNKFLNDFHLQTKRELDLLGGEDQSDEVDEGVENPRWLAFKALMMLLFGTVIAAVFADPLADAIINFSDATSIPPFFTSIIAWPLATSIDAEFASPKKIRAASLTFSMLYGSVTMKNLLCLSVFLALVYIRELTWDFTHAVLDILIVCIVMGGFASFRTTFPLWTCLVPYILTPFSLALVSTLCLVFGWS